jgi:hypothetical protein
MPKKPASKPRSTGWSRPATRNTPTLVRFLSLLLLLLLFADGAELASGVGHCRETETLTASLLAFVLRITAVEYDSYKIVFRRYAGLYFSIGVSAETLRVLPFVNVFSLIDHIQYYVIPNARVFVARWTPMKMN